LAVLRFIVHHHLTLEMLPLQGTVGNTSPEGSLVIDVGGGIGAESLTLANHYPNLRFVVQDRESVMGDAIEVCSESNHSHQYMARTDNVYWS
jgi:ubiquinone/menaquinone biosynthesis C-methylase UbiE